jgi:hypothetical protein
MFCVYVNVCIEKIIFFLFSIYQKLNETRKFLSNLRRIKNHTIILAERDADNNDDYDYMTMVMVVVVVV